jgi:hypothetical protein
MKTMSRIAIDITEDQHKKLKAMAALRGQTIKNYILEQTLGARETDDVLLKLEKLIERRAQAAKAAALSRKTASDVFAEAGRKS